MDFRKIGVDTFIPGPGSGYFDFDKDMTSSNGGSGSATDGNAFAAFLMGYPSGQSSRQSTFPISTPLNRRRIGPPRLMTGRERRRLDPTKGLWKVLERRAEEPDARPPRAGVRRLAEKRAAAIVVRHTTRRGIA